MPIKEDRALYNVERKEASDFLEVSLRTIDRYIRSGKLSHRKVGYNIYLSMRELEQFKKMRVQQVEDVIIHENGFEEIEESVTFEHTQQSNDGNFETLVYKNLYESSRKELSEKQKEVEFLQYKLGKMEIELGNALPLLEYQKSQKEAEQEIDKLEVKTLEIKEELLTTRYEYKKTHMEKTMYAYVAVGASTIALILFVVSLL